MRSLLASIALAITMPLCLQAHADSFSLSSTDITEGQPMGKAQEFTGFGCDGGNRSPQLSWANAPAGTEAFAIMAYDPDAPTGSGWWHWQLINIPKTVTELPAGAGSASGDAAPAGSRHIKNDFGVAAFGGACPPKGHGVHHYQFTVYALSQMLELPEDPSGALTGYMVMANSLGSATLEALYERN
ncbi:MAG: YbhB/YbcL family Raf kinase inhibitor-like protein [Pseudomonadota bacterium]